MYKQSLAALFVMATLAGCASTKVQNPVNYITFRNEPLVKDVEKGMSQQEVLRIGGTPSGTQKRLMKPGSCNSYILNKDGQQQPFYVSFDGSGKVDGSGFLSSALRIVERPRMSRLRASCINSSRVISLTEVLP